MKKFIKYLFLSLGLMALHSCYEDKGNYDYADRKQLTVRPIGDYVRILGNDTISIRPEILTLENGAIFTPDPDNYTYEWVWYNARIGERTYNAYVVSRDRVLEGHKLGLPRGKHQLYYKVTDKNGISFFSDLFAVTVESDLARGFMILCDVNDKARMDYLNYSSKGNLTPIVDLFEKIGTNPPAMGRPLGVACYYDNNAPIMMSYLNGNAYGICTMTTEGSFRISFTDFSYKPDYDFKSVFIGKLPANFMAQTIITSRAFSPGSGEGALYEANNRDMYYYNAMMQKIWNAGMRCNVVDGVRFNTVPHAIIKMFMGAILFDDDSKSFANYDMMSATASYYTQTELKSTGKDLLMLKTFIGDLNRALAIMRETGGGKYYMLLFNHADGSNAALHELSLTDGANATDFCMGSFYDLRQYVYYRTDTKVYAINTGTLKVTEAYSAPVGQKISLIKIVKNGGANDYTEPLWMDDLMVCTYDPALPAESCGTFAIHRPTAPNGVLELVVHNGTRMTWGGFGKIVDADFKQK